MVDYDFEVLLFSELKKMQKDVVKVIFIFEDWQKVEVCVKVVVFVWDLGYFLVEFVGIEMKFFCVFVVVKYWYIENLVFIWLGWGCKLQWFVEVLGMGKMVEDLVIR